MSLLSTRRAGTRPRFLLAAGARARGRALLAGRRWLRARSIPIEPMKFYSLPTLAQGEASTTFGDAGPKSGFLHIWGRRGAGRGCGRQGRGGGWRIQIWGPNVYRPARDTASAPNVWRADTHSACELVSTCAGYRFGSERVSSGYTFAAQMCIGEPRDKLLATSRTWQRRVGCARPTAPRSPRESPPLPLRAGSPTAGPPRTPQRWPAR